MAVNSVRHKIVMTLHQDSFLNQIVSYGIKIMHKKSIVFQIRSNKGIIPTCLGRIYKHVKEFCIINSYLFLNAIMITANYSVTFGLIRQVTNTVLKQNSKTEKKNASSVGKMSFFFFFQSWIPNKVRLIGLCRDAHRIVSATGLGQTCSDSFSCKMWNVMLLIYSAKGYHFHGRSTD